MIRYAIPGMYEQRFLNYRLLKLHQRNPEYFYDNVDIEIAYGNPQFCIWDGGRIFPNYKQTPIEIVEETIRIYNEEFDVPVRYVFTNTELEEKHFHNRFGNCLLEAGNKYHNEVVLGNEDFLRYIKEHYSTYRFVSSTTKCITNPQELHEELAKEDFRLVCWDYNLNKNKKLIESLTEEEIKKSEFLVNAICAPGCPHRKEHYKLNSLSHLNYGREYRMDGCAIKYLSTHPNQMHNNNNLTYEDITRDYEPLGFEHFKIEGRTWGIPALACTYADFMIKPEYKSLVISILCDAEQDEQIHRIK